MKERKPLLKDVHRAYDRLEGGTSSRVLALIRSPGLHAVAVYRFGNWLLDQSLLVNIVLLPVYLLVNYYIKAFWRIRIRRRAIIGEGLYIGHWGEIFITGMAVIGKNCDLHQSVSIGVHRSGRQYGYPIIGDNVQIGPGAKIYGRVNIGNNVRIDPNATVYCNIPDNALVSGAPLQIPQSPPLLGKRLQAKVIPVSNRSTAFST